MIPPRVDPALDACFFADVLGRELIARVGAFHNRKGKFKVYKDYLVGMWNAVFDL